MEKFNPEQFVNASIPEVKKQIGTEKALVAVSGGVDSMTCAVLTHKAIGEKLVCVILDDAFMREGEPEHVVETLRIAPFKVPAKIVDVRERFLKAMKGLTDAEEKRKKFRETFYKVLGETAKQEGCRVLVQGTIKADIIETVGGVKTQHNVLMQMGIDPVAEFGFQVVEPLITLLKWQVRMAAKHLGLPQEFVERQPFPGPGLTVRIVGEIRPDKLETLKKATRMAEEELSKFKPSQYFAVIMDNEESAQQKTAESIQKTAAQFVKLPAEKVHVRIFQSKATGLKGGKRQYGRVVGISAENPHIPSTSVLVPLQDKIVAENPDVTRVFYSIKDIGGNKPYVIGVRAVKTEDFLSAKVADVPWSAVEAIAKKTLEQCPNVSTVYFDITPKPPATVEME